MEKIEAKSKLTENEVMPGGINGEVHEGEINYCQVKTERKIKV